MRILRAVARARDLMQGKSADTMAPIAATGRG
jgi:hypothetical protein